MLGYEAWGAGGCVYGRVRVACLRILGVGIGGVKVGMVEGLEGGAG